MQAFLDLLNNDTNLMVFLLAVVVWAFILPRVVAKFLLPYWGKLQPWVQAPLRLLLPQLKPLLQAEWFKLHAHLTRKVQATPGVTDDELLALGDKMVKALLDD